MRYYLDTNILVFLKQGQTDELCADVREIVRDYSSVLYTSTTCVQEFIHLRQIGKVRLDKRDKRGVRGIRAWLDNFGIEVRPVTDRHIDTFAALPMHDDHRDPSDRIIIAQAIADRIPLISSDRKFRLYERYGLEFVVNER